MDTNRHEWFGLGCLWVLGVLLLGSSLWAQELPKALGAGLEVKLFAAEPLIQTPTGCVVDGKGRLLVIESHTHFRPKDWKGSEHDEIVWLKDTDNDGTADQREVVLNETDATMDIAYHPDGWIYVATRNEILRWRDDNDDGKPDALERKLLFLDTKGNYPHNGLSGLAFDGRGGLYFGLGENLGVSYKLRGQDDELTDDGGGGGAVFWCALDGKRLRKVSTGFWNPFGVCVDGEGNVFATDNDPDSRPPCRLIHVVEGGDYGYAFRYGRSGLHPFVAWNGELPGTLPMVAGTGEAPCDVIFWRGSLLVASWVDHRLEKYDLQAKDGSFTGKRSSLLEGGLDFRPVAMAPTADGGFYLTDWVKRDYALHGHGRVWKVTPAADAASSVASTSVTDEGAVLRKRILEGEAPNLAEARAWLMDGRPFVRSAAIYRLGREEFLLSELAEQSWGSAELDANVLLAARQAVRFQSGQLPPLVVRTILRSLAHPSEQVNIMALKWIADERLGSFKSAVEAVSTRSGTSAAVYYGVVTTLARLEDPELNEEGMRQRLMKDIRDGAAPAARRRMALEIFPDRDRYLKLADVLPVIESADSAQQPWLIHYAGTLRDKTVGSVMREMALNTKYSFDARAAAMAHASFEASDVKALAAMALSSELAEPTRRAALQALTGMSLPDDIKTSLENQGNLRLKQYARRALGLSSSAKARPALDDLDRWSTLLANAEGQSDVLNGRMVFMSPRLGGCSVCHRADGLGSGAGPDLSSIGLQGGVQPLLESLLQPSRSVAPRYESYNVVTADGQTRMGFPLLERGGDHTYIDLGGNAFEVKIDDLVKREALPVSIMPEGLVNRLTDAELRDLLAYLQAQKRGF
jgi:putative membrane-bound dehydrogenase-like protein